MMHFYAVVLIPDEGDVEELVAEAMEPYSEELVTDWDSPDNVAFWDWWQIGGRWTGVWNPEYNADAANYGQWSTQWMRYEGDVRPAHEVPVDDEFIPYRMVTSEGVIAREHPNPDWKPEDGYDDYYIRDDNFELKYKAALAAAKGMRAVVVDYHS